MRGNSVRWTNGIVPYEFSTGFGKCLFLFSPIIFRVFILNLFGIFTWISNEDTINLYVSEEIYIWYKNE